MVEDDSGALWIASSRGLYRREDQGRTTRYGANDGLASERIRALLSDRDGAVWVGTALGLCRLSHDPGTKRLTVIQVFTTSDGPPADVVDLLLRTSGGRLWAGTNQGLAELLYPQRFDG